MPDALLSPTVPNPCFRSGRFNGELSLPDMTSTDEIVTVTSSRTGSLTLTLTELQDLAALYQQARRVSHTFRNTTRRAHLHPMTMTGLPAQPIPVRGSADAYPLAVTLTGHSPSAEGTPLLTWGPVNIAGQETDGWTLTLVGGGDMSIGVARWDNETGIRGLISQMVDQETLLITAGMLDPDRMGHLAARMTARTLMDERAFRRVTLTPIRRMLTANTLNTADGTDRAQRILLRVLSIRFNDKRLPIACALMAPNMPATALAEINRRSDEWVGRPYSEQATLRENISISHRQTWAQSVRDALPGIGWRVLDLPAPNRGWRHRSSTVVWATPLDEDTWSLVDRAAAREAETLSMERGSPA
jgi:hypothetical protein